MALGDAHIEGVRKMYITFVEEAEAREAPSRNMPGSEARERGKLQCGVFWSIPSRQWGTKNRAGTIPTPIKGSIPFGCS